MKAIFRHELSSYFTSVYAYVFAAFLLLFAGIYTMAINISSAYTDFEYVLSNMSFIFLIIVPIITMRVIAEERRQRTDNLLYSLPFSMTDVTLGKYFALLVVFLIPVLIIGLYPIILSAFGNMNLKAAFSGLLGFYLLGAALIAIGMFISSLTENQAVAAGLCFVVMLVNYFIVSLAAYVSSTSFASFMAFTIVIILAAVIFFVMTRNGFAAAVMGLMLEAALMILYIIKTDLFEGLFSDVMEQLSVFQRFYDMTEGIFDIRSVVYLISVACVFVFLTVQSLEKRRWSE